MNLSRGASFLARQAEKFLYEDSLPSSDSSIDLHRSLSPEHKSLFKSSRRYTDTHSDHLNKTRDTTLKQSGLSRQSSKKRVKSPEASIKLDASRNKSLGNKSIMLNTTRLDDLAKPKSCQQEKYFLHSKIGDLESLVNKQSKKVKKLYERIMEKREEVKDLTDQLYDSKKKSLVILDLKERVKTLETSELSLVQELNEQQKITRTTLNKLYELQEEWAIESEKTKKQYQEHYNKRLDDQQANWEAKVRQLEDENWKLMSRIREMETNEEIEKKKQNIVINGEIVSLKSHVTEKTLENERLKEEVNELKNLMTESEKASTLEIKTLKNTIDILMDQNKTLKTNEDEATTRDLQERNQLRRRIESLQEDLEQKDKIIREKDLSYREQLETISKKVTTLQLELKKLTECEEKVEELQRSLDIKDNELELTRKYYKEKLEGKKISQERQKKEWSGIYSELLSEIKILKGEIDNLGGENRKLLSSLRNKERREYF